MRFLNLFKKMFFIRTGEPYQHPSGSLPRLEASAAGTTCLSVAATYNATGIAVFIHVSSANAAA